MKQTTISVLVIDRFVRRHILYCCACVLCKTRVGFFVFSVCALHDFGELNAIYGQYTLHEILSVSHDCLALLVCSYAMTSLNCLL